MNKNSNDSFERTSLDESNRFWTELAINQLGTTLNFFSIISIGFFTYVVENNKLNNLFTVRSDYVVDWSKFFIVLSLLTCFFSIVFSSIAIVSRLYDLRLTRHTIWTRLRYFKKYGSTLKDDFLHLSPKTTSQFCNFWLVIINEDNYLITDKHIDENETIEARLHNLRQRNMLLGKLSYKMFKYQVVSILFMIILFILSIIV